MFAYFFVTILFIGYQNDHAKFFFEKMFTVTFDSFFLCDANNFDKSARERSPALQSQIFHRRFRSNYRQFSRIIKFQKREDTINEYGFYVACIVFLLGHIR